MMGFRTTAQALVKAGDISLAVNDIGEGPPVVWLHGGGPGTSGMGTYGKLMPAFDDYRNVVIDLPRFGGSDRPTIDEPVIPYMASRLEAVLTELGIQRAHMIGMSTGAAAAAVLAAKRPELINRLVLTTAGVPAPGWVPPATFELVTAYMTAAEPSRELIRRVLEAAVYDTSLVTDEVVDARLAVATRTHPELPPPVVLGDIQSDLTRIRAATLVLWGREDAFLPFDPHATFVGAQIPDSEIRVLPRCGHQPPLEVPRQFTSAVREFLGESR